MVTEVYGETNKGTKMTKTWYITFNDLKEVFSEDFDIPIYYPGIEMSSSIMFSYSWSEAFTTQLRIRVTGETTYNGYSVWVLTLEPFESEVERNIGGGTVDHRRYYCDGSKAGFVEWWTWRGKFLYYVTYVIYSFKEFKILVDKETGIAIYAKITGSYTEYFGAGAKTPEKLPLDTKIEDYSYELRINIIEKRYYGFLTFLLDEDFDYSKGAFVINPLSEKELKVIHTSTGSEKTVKLDSQGRVNASELILKDSSGKVLTGRYKLVIEEKSLSWFEKYWYYKTYEYFPTVYIWYDVVKEDNFYVIKVLKTINARVSTASLNLFEENPLDVTHGATVKLRTVVAWDKLIRYTVYRFLKEAGVSEEKAKHIRDLPVYYGTGIAHYTTVYWEKIKVEHSASEFYRFFSDKGFTDDIEGIFHEYGHAIRENVWTDPSRYFRWFKLGGKHEATYLPASNEYLAFDEGHSDMMASMLIEYAKTHLKDLYDVPLPETETYSSSTYKGNKYKGELVEGRVAGLILSLFGTGPDAYENFLKVVDKTKYYTTIKYCGLQYSRPPRTITEWVSVAYKLFPSKRSEILKLCNEYNIQHFFDPPKSTGGFAGKYILLYVNYYLTGGGAAFGREGKSVTLKHDSLLGALLHDDDIFTGSKVYGTIWFDDLVIYFDSGSSEDKMFLFFENGVLEVRKASIRIETFKPNNWFKVKVGNYIISNFRSEILVEADGKNISIAVLKGSVYVKTPTKTVKLTAGKKLTATGKKYSIGSFKQLDYSMGENIGVTLKAVENDLVYGDTLKINVSASCSSGWLTILAYNRELGQGFVLYNSTVEGENFVVSQEYLPAGNYTITGVLRPANSFIGYESDPIEVLIKRSTPQITLTVSSNEATVGDEITVQGSITRYRSEVYVNVTKPSGETTTHIVELNDTSFTLKIKLDEKGLWKIVAYVPETSNNYASTSNTVTIEAKEAFNILLIAGAAIAIIAVIGAIIWLKRKSKPPPPPPPYPPPPPPP